MRSSGPPAVRATIFVCTGRLSAPPITGLPSICATHEASSADWLYPRLNCLIQCIGTGTTQSIRPAMPPSRTAAAMPWANTHHEHALRTLIIGYAIWALAGALMLINGAFLPVTLFGQLAIALWALIRAVIALVLGIMRKPIPHPRGILV